LKLNIILSVLFALAACTLVAGAQDVPLESSSVTFTDLSLQQTDILVYMVNNGSTSYMYTVNSSASFFYDPTSDYILVLKPTLGSTYGTSAEGLLSYAQDNPEMAALVFIVVMFCAVCAIIFWGFRKR
jgi:hypothetical protein